MTYRPWHGRGIGIELEMNRTRANGASFSLRDLENVVRNALPSSATIRREDFNAHNSGEHWEVKTDGSCGYEFTTPVLTLDEEGDNAQLKSVCDALKEFRPRIDRNCGFHLHVSCRGAIGQRDWTWQDLQRFLALWSRYEPYLFEMLPPSRKNNTYCQPVHKHGWTAPTSQTFDTIQRALNTNSANRFQEALRGRSRYHAVNTTHFWLRGSIEFRLHSGTVDYVKIRNWAKLILAMVARVTNEDMPRIQLNVSDSPEGFSTRYIFRQFGLIVGRHIREVPASNRELLVWADARRLLFDPNAMRRPGMRDATGRRVRINAIAAPEGGAEESHGVAINERIDAFSAGFAERNVQHEPGMMREARARADISGRSVAEEREMMRRAGGGVVRNARLNADGTENLTRADGTHPEFDAQVEPIAVTMPDGTRRAVETRSDVARVVRDIANGGR